MSIEYAYYVCDLFKELTILNPRTDPLNEALLPPAATVVRTGIAGNIASLAGVGHRLMVKIAMRVQAITTAMMGGTVGLHMMLTS